MKRLKRLVRLYRRWRALSNIRQGIATLGLDLSDLSDEQLEVALLEGSLRLMKAGITAERFAHALHSSLSDFRLVAKGWTN